MRQVLRRALPAGVACLLIAGCAGTVLPGVATPGPGVPVDAAAAELPITGDTGDPIDQEVRNALADLDRFWSEHYAEFFGDTYVRPLGGYFSVDPDEIDEVDYPDAGVGCPASPAPPDSVAGNAWYDGACDTIAYDRTLLDELATDHGRSLAAVVVAHEFGHAMQGRFGFADSGRSIQDETQADCLAGAWTAWVVSGEARHVSIRRPELDDVVAGFLLLRDDVGADPEGDEAHGSAFDRVSAFFDGFDGGLGPCRDEFGADRPFTAATFSPGDTNQGDAPYAEIIELVGITLPVFWNAVFPEAFGAQFRPPALAAFDGTAPDCGDLGGEDRDLGYCASEETVYYDETDLVRPAYEEQGDFAVATALSLPYALAAREQAGLSADDGAATRSAVCLAGWFTQQWYAGAFVDTLEATLSPGDVDEAVQFLLTYGIDERVFPGVAASGFELVGAFRAGFLDGGRACDIGL